MRGPYRWYGNLHDCGLRNSQQERQFITSCERPVTFFRDSWSLIALLVQLFLIEQLPFEALISISLNLVGEITLLVRCHSWTTKFYLGIGLHSSTSSSKQLRLVMKDEQSISTLRLLVVLIPSQIERSSPFELLNRFFKRLFTSFYWTFVRFRLCSGIHGNIPARNQIVRHAEMKFMCFFESEQVALIKNYFFDSKVDQTLKVLTSTS